MQFHFLIKLSDVFLHQEFCSNSFLYLHLLLQRLGAMVRKSLDYKFSFTRRCQMTTKMKPNRLYSLCKWNWRTPKIYSQCERHVIQLRSGFSVRMYATALDRNAAHYHDAPYFHDMIHYSIVNTVQCTQCMLYIICTYIHSVFRSNILKSKYCSLLQPYAFIAVK